MSSNIDSISQMSSNIDSISQMSSNIEEPIMVQPPKIIIPPLPEGYIHCNHGLLKYQRNLILNETDKYLIPDYPISAEQLETVKEYRTALRDFTLNDYILPDKPDFVITMN